MNDWTPSRMRCPWVESPFFEELLRERPDLSETDAALCNQYHRDGYLILEHSVGDAVIDKAREDVERLIADGRYKPQERGYHYSKGPRVFEAWKESEAVRRVATDPAVCRVLRMLYDEAPKPFQTINFTYGSNQPLHSDVVHFDSMPPSWMAASWSAFEDMDENNGTLVFIPGSHRWPVYRFYDIGEPTPRYGEQFDSYHRYEDFIRRLTERSLPKRFMAKKGQVLVWAANLIHGGDAIRDPGRSRHSQATHYYFQGIDLAYSPMFTDPLKGEFSRKDLTGKDIGGMA